LLQVPLLTLDTRDGGGRPGTAMRSQRILLVEDDRVVQELLTLFLNETYELRQAATGAEALAILHREPISAVVLDYRLPDRTGLEVLTEIKSSQPRLPVIMMTGYGSESVCASAFKLGVSDYFPKPFSILDLVYTVRRILSGPTVGPEPSRPALPHENQPELERPLPARRPDFAIQKAAELIQQRYWDRLSLSRLAREVGMSKYRFSRRFREVMGIGFRDYVISVRLARAKDLLSTTLASITEVALMVGFGDLPRFDKLFKRYTGLTPHAYRTRHRAPDTK
jgi:two-component system, response regulator YesN